MRLFRALRLKARIALRLLWLRKKYPPAYRFVKDHLSWMRRVARYTNKGNFPAIAADAALDRIGEAWGIRREAGEPDGHYKDRILKKYDTMQKSRR